MPVEPVHSTDAHGVTELNFALTYLLDMAFQARMKAFHRATLFTMPGVSFPESTDYSLALGGPINTKLIEEQYDNIKRLLSTLLRRLTSQSNLKSIYVVWSPGGIRASCTNDVYPAILE